jgi:hypothetical protein
VPTFERLPRFDREFRRMPKELHRAFLAMLPVFIAALVLVGQPPPRR